jgi:hypothetical protein
MIYGWTIFAASFLLFQIQPLTGRWIAPRFGGSVSVWTTCLVFFQIMLLLGYLYAHFLSSKLLMKKQVIAHVSFIAFSLILMTLAVTLRHDPLFAFASQESGSQPVFRILEILLISVGLPFFLLSSTAPLIQKWLSYDDVVPPYRLYALSNAASLLGLISYPFAIEPHLTLKHQATLWSAGYVLFAALSIIGATRLFKVKEMKQESSPVPFARKGLWISLAACGSLMLVSSTNQICREIASIPFLWIVPLIIYLLSYILCFSSNRFHQSKIFPILWAPVLFLTCVALYEGIHVSLFQQIVIYSLALFTGCMICHGWLYKSRPGKQQLTVFYICIAAGGAFGGFFSTIVASFIMKGYWEFHLALWLISFVLFWTWIRNSLPALWVRYSYLTALAILGYALSRQIAGDLQGAVFLSRNFYGVLAILREDPGSTSERYTLRHGRILHGSQYQIASQAMIPTAYYGRNSGAGIAIQYLQTVGPVRAGIVGLGVGTLASYGRKFDYFRFYEIDPGVIALSRPPLEFFHYLQRCPAKIDVVEGDGRLSMERDLKQGSQNFDFLVIDAFSSDSIPAHLLTVEAMNIYLQHLNPDHGILGFHISNRFLDLKPVIAGLATSFGKQSRAIESQGVDAVILSSTWMLVGPPETLQQITRNVSTETVTRTVVWTDDYYSILPILKTK